jgi:polysaccharide chain length determinant protein (PEP-CTERM system associated)
MHELLELILDEARSAWRFRWTALAVAAGVALAGWLAVFAWRDTYEAEARVFVDTRTALKPVLQNLALEQDVNAQLNYVKQSLLAGPQLKKIAIDSGMLPATVVDPAKQADILDRLGSSVVITVVSASEKEQEQGAGGSIYGIIYRNADRAQAVKVVQTVLNTLIDETLGGKRQNSETAQKFLGDQIREYEKRLRAAEDRLAEFKKRNVGLMPTEQGGYFTLLQQETDAARKAETDLSIAMSRRAALERQLRGANAIAATSMTVSVTGSQPTGGDTVSRIRETQARLDDLLLRFTDKHPDVIATKATLEELKQRRQGEIERLKRGDAETIASSGAGNSPVFQSIQLGMNQADIEIATLRGQLAQHRSTVAELRKRLDSAPKVEAEYAQLDRDYGVNKAQYTALLANYEKAHLGEQADNAGSVRFEVVQPPTADFQPVSPQRSLTLIATLLAALGVGAGVAYLMHMLHPVVTSVRSLATLTGLPVLGVVGSAFPERQRLASRMETRKFAAGAACLLGALAVALAMNIAGVRLSL